MRNRLAALVLAAACLTPASASAANRPVDITATVRTQNATGATLVQSGPFSGSPFGRGTVKLNVHVGAGSGATFTFKLLNRHGQVWGTGDAKIAVKGATLSYTGTARITGGSGAFARYRASRVTLRGSGPVTSETFKVRLTGTATD